MTTTANAGPLIIFGQNQTAGTYNPDLGPSAVYGGVGLYDPRFGYAHGGDGNGSVGCYGFAPALTATVIDQVPSQIATANIAALANVSSGVPMTLVSSSGAGITVTTAATTIPQTGNVVPSGALAIDLLPATIVYGQNLFYAVADPRQNIARAISVTGVTSGTGGAFTVSGYDLYGYPQTETLTAGAGVNTVNTKKTYKFIKSITPGFNDAHNYSIGTTDIYGLPLLANSYGYVDATWNNAPLTSPTFVAADGTAAGLTTGDVRGTIVVSSASDGTKRLVVMMGVAPQNIVTTSLTGLFGVTPA